MFSNRCLRLLWAVGIVFLVAACVQTGPQGSQAAQTVATKPAGAACRASDGVVANGTVVYHCAVPGQGVTGCPRYTCRRCNDGTWGSEYSCRLQ